VEGKMGDMRITVAQLGARMHYAVPRIFHEAGLLERLFTDSYSGNKPRVRAVLQIMPKSLRPRNVDRWLDRREPRLPPEKVTSFEHLGFRYMLAQRRVRGDEPLQRIFVDHGRAFNEQVIVHGLGAADTVWGFNGAALELFRWAKRQGLRCLLEQTMAPQRVLREELRRELERWPGWEPGLHVSEANGLLEEREEAEWRLADCIVAGSRFVMDGVAAAGVTQEKFRLAPYGVDLTSFVMAVRREPETACKLRVLFVGEVGLRKGAPYLLEALRRLGSRQVEARFAGRIALDRNRLAPYAETVDFLGAVPRSAMASLYQWADFLVLPSLCEGSATTTYEALASGVPVICTPNTGSIIRDGFDGHIVPPRSTEALLALLDRYATRREELQPLRHAVRTLAKEFSYEAYRDRLLTAIGARA
jgi:glycosyltransferase involved in cell wall biosynthesis